MAFLEFAHFLREATTPTIDLTDNKSIMRFIHTKADTPTLGNAFGYVLHFNFYIEHIASSVSTSADFFSTLEVNVTEKMRVKTRQDIQTTPIEFIASSLDVAHEEQIFLTQAVNKKELEEQTFQRKINLDNMQKNGQRTRNHRH